jgi:hypothetical protein
LRSFTDVHDDLTARHVPHEIRSADLDAVLESRKLPIARR